MKNCICSLTIVCLVTRPTKSCFCAAFGQLAVEQQVAHLEEVAFDRELLDRVAAVEELALVAVDERDRRAAGGGRQEARVVGKAAGLAVERADVDDVGADAAGEDRKSDGGRAVGEGQCRGAVGHDVVSPSIVVVADGGTRVPGRPFARVTSASSSLAVGVGRGLTAPRASVRPVAGSRKAAAAARRRPAPHGPKAGPTARRRRKSSRRSSDASLAVGQRCATRVQETREDQIVFQHAAPAAPAQAVQADASKFIFVAGVQASASLTRRASP